MPPVIIKTSKDRIDPIRKVFPELTKIVAQELTSKDRALASEDISIYVEIPEVTYNAPDTTIIIGAHRYVDRIPRADEICDNIQEYMQKNCPEAGIVKVHLPLSDYGYSFGKKT